ncbi:hypothetical protein RND71_010548 [Anisodus tanguticus]|uniref:Transposase, Ptta/En/Spm, plant n=1 Tax=Anisodus tanguticus TaxID=243964 RepID=A0AAE1SKI6_9SOLA|nr:hypothetical protein RND71_010548 [Anisodus tanguticus]
MVRGGGRGRGRPRKAPLTSFGSSAGARLVVDTPIQSHAAAEVTPIQTEEPSVEDVGPSERRPYVSRKLNMSSIPSKVPKSNLVADPVTEKTNGTVGTPVAETTVAALSSGTVNPSVKGKEAQDVNPPEEPWFNLFKKNRVAANGNMPRGKGRKHSWAGRGGIANKGGKSSQQLENISQTDIPEASTPSSQGDMPRGRSCKRSWAGQGGIADKGGKSSQQLQIISQKDIPEPPPLSSQGNVPWGQGRKRSWADRGGITSKGGRSSQNLQNISEADIPELPPASSQGNTPRGKGRKHSWADRGGIAIRGGKSSQQVQNISEADIPEPPPASSQGNIPKGRKRSWADQGGIANRGGKNSQQVQNIIQTVITELSPPSSQGVDSYQCAVSSHGSGFQHSQDVEYQQMPRTSHADKDVSSQQPTLAYQETTGPQKRQHIAREIIPLRVNGDTFFPHDAVRDVAVAFKKSFVGSWYSWSKVPEHVRDQWFNDFEKKYSFHDADKHLIRKTFDRVGSERLSDTLSKAKKEFAKTRKIPKWISQSHWDGLMQYWNSDDFQRISAINSKNRTSCNNGEGPSLHTGGSVPFAEYRRRHKELTGQELRNEELFLKTHKNKDKEWIDEKSQRVWDMFTKSIKKNVEGTSTQRDENGSEVEVAVDSEDEKTEEANEDSIVNLLQTVPDKQLLNTWIDAVGRPKKGKIYGLGLETGYRGGSLHVNSASSTAPTPTVTPQQIVETPEFEQILNRVLDQRMADMQASLHASIRTVMQEEIEVAVRAVMSRMLGFPAPRSNGSGSCSGLP